MSNSISGVLHKIFFYRDNFLIGRLADGSSVKGNLREPQIGMEYFFFGEWKSNGKWGNTFIFTDYRTCYPKDLSAIRAYLAENCKWIGPEISKKLVNTFGKETLQVCKDNPELVAKKIAGITLQRAKEVSAMLRNNEANEELQIALKKVLEGIRISYRAVSKIVEKYGQSAPDIIRQNPYALIEEIEGIGFLTADEIALKVGFAQDGVPRIKAGIFHVLKESAFSEGHTCLPQNILTIKTVKLLDVSKSLIEKVLAQLLADEHLEYVNDRYFIPAFYNAERAIARKLKKLVSRECEIIKPQTHNLFPDQIEALKKMSNSNVFILTGAPGTGKTFLVRRIIESFPEKKIALAAPTGKAAKRMFELTGHPAQTIHKLLEPTREDDRFKFTRNAENPIQTDILIVDELSMTDVSLMASLLDAVAEDTRLIFVGDFYQLPSVGPGNVLKDIIASGIIPCAELTIIKRQDEAGLIIKNCHRIKDGKNIVIDNSEKSDFFFIKCETEKEISKTIIDFVTHKIPASYTLRDVQILSPLRKKTSISCKPLNEICQQILNKNEPVKNYKFKKGDKVIQTKNDYGYNIINGDIGYVRMIDTENEIIEVDFENPDRNVSLPLRENQLDLAYACTVHKYQGSEAPIIIIPIHHSFGTFIPQRNLLYTAISRAQKVCILVGEHEEVPKIIRRNKQHNRFTNLERFLCEKETTDNNYHGLTGAETVPV